MGTLSATSGCQTALLDPRSPTEDSSAFHSRRSSAQKRAPFWDTADESNYTMLSSNTSSIDFCSSVLSQASCSSLGAPTFSCKRRGRTCRHRDADTAWPFACDDADTAWPFTVRELMDLSDVITMPSRSFDQGIFDSRSSPPHHIPAKPSTPDSVECPICGREFSGIFRVGNLARHKKSVHSSLGIFCPEDDCSKVFRRQDARLKHIRKHHPHLASGPVPRSMRKPTRPHASLQIDTSEISDGVARTEPRD